jgi:hypothetical protein
MFSQFSIRQLLIATAGVAILISIVATGIRQDNSMGWGVVISLSLLPVLFVAYGIVTVLARTFCQLGNSILGPLDTSTFTNVVVQRQPVMSDQVPEAHADLDEGNDDS